jgi:integrase
LQRYAARRTQRFPEAAFFFVNRTGHRLPYTTVRTTFRRLTQQLGWVKNGQRPRLHDLRHYPEFRTIPSRYSPSPLCKDSGWKNSA